MDYRLLEKARDIAIRKHLFVAALKHPKTKKIKFFVNKGKDILFSSTDLYEILEYLEGNK